ncbi:hypothetical protein [Kangiella sp.]|uniref:hypothetical protein n=1 Tax=Kangiella sp. TaxID=1920245 RepID=UPI00199827FA|nr:hypothetical protein [Kangiella sp.]MBD3652770.1 hypothetical protein [Kangiella sp.]
MNKFCIVVTGLTLLSASSSLKAHELPTDSLNTQTNVAVAVSFNFSEAQLNHQYTNYAQFFDYKAWLVHKKGAELEESCEVQSQKLAQQKTCGQVDHFYQAALIGTNTCNAYASLHASQYPQGLIPRFTAPASFVDNLQAANGHHENYDFTQGLSFDCVYELRELEPVEVSRTL